MKHPQKIFKQNFFKLPIEIHKTYNMNVPQLIMGNLLTSSNYNDNGFHFFFIK